MIIRCYENEEFLLELSHDYVYFIGNYDAELPRLLPRLSFLLLSG